MYEKTKKNTILQKKNIKNINNKKKLKKTLVASATFCIYDQNMYNSDSFNTDMTIMSKKLQLFSKYH